MPVAAVIGYDGSPAANAAIDAGGLLFRNAHAWITYLWTPPFTSGKLRNRVQAVARNVDELIEMIEREGEREAERLVAMGVTLARSGGWDAEPLVKRTWAAEGLGLAQLAEQRHADLVLVGSRGLGGTDAILGSVSELVVHHSANPVLVVPHPLLAAEYDALADGPVLVGWDGSAGAETAFTAAEQLFPQRDVLLVCVDEGGSAAAPADPQGGNREVLHLKSGHGSHARATSDALIACAGERNAAVMVMGSRGRSAVREILLGSVVRATLHNAHRPVMVVPRPRSARQQD